MPQWSGLGAALLLTHIKPVAHVLRRTAER
jgi:hypothetical protein